MQTSILKYYTLPRDLREDERETDGGKNEIGRQILQASERVYSRFLRFSILFNRTKLKKHQVVSCPQRKEMSLSLLHHENPPEHQ